MDSSTRWLNELENPTEGFFAAFHAKLREPRGLLNAVSESVSYLTPLVDWEGHLPQVPHGLLGLRAVLGLKGYLPEARFLRLLAIQLHAFAHEPRRSGAGGLQGIGKGSGHWPNLEMALRDHRPAIAWGESLGVEEPRAEDFARLLPFIVGDMANVGHKAVAVHHIGGLFVMLDRPKIAGRCLLGLAAWIAATEPSDRFWNARIRKRLDGANVRIVPGSACLDPEQHLAGAREICDLGLVAMLDAFTGRMKAGMNEGDLLTTLALAASEKQLDARRDIEGKTSWNFVYLATLPFLAGGTACALQSRCPPCDPHLVSGQSSGTTSDLAGAEPWAQAAALLNFFPTDDEEDRVKADPPKVEPTDIAAALLDAILDSEPGLAMGLVPLLRAKSGDEGVLRILAEAASLNDPTFNHSHQILTLAAAAELLPRITEPAKDKVLTALAKSLANSQGSGELGTLADQAWKA